MIPATPLPPSHRQPDWSRLHCLVVDDFAAMRTLLRDVLRNCGANSIDLAADGAAAVELLARRKYDLVLCDYNLGSGKNGQQVLEEAKVRRLIGPACAWVMVTAEKTGDSVTGAAELQPDAYLIKPITEANLQARLTKIWRKKAAFIDIDRALAAEDYQRAIRLCDERAQIDKANSVELLRTKCNVLMEIGELAQAQQAFEGVLAERDLPWAKAGLAKVHYHQANYQRAASLLIDVVDHYRAYLDAYDWLAKTLRRQGKLEESESILLRAVQLSPNAVQRQQVLGDVALRLGHLDRAEHAFQQSIALGEHSVRRAPDAHLGLAKTYGQQHRVRDAIKTLDAVQQQFDSDDAHWQSRVVQGLVYLQNGMTAEARATAAALKAQPDRGADRLDTLPALDFAALMIGTGDQAFGVQLLLDQVRNHPEDVEILDCVQRVFHDADLDDQSQGWIAASRQEATDMMDTGVLLARDGRLDDAVAWLRNATARLPANARVLFNYVQVLVLRMQQVGVDPATLDEARAALRRANQLAPMQTRYGQLREALDALQRAAP